MLLPHRALRLAVLLSVALSAVWALSSPLGAVPDEPTHVVYAAAVVRGQSPQQGTDPVLVPATVAEAESTLCLEYRRAVTADCIPELVASSKSVTATTRAAGYPRLYYWLVGWPSLLSFDSTTWYAMRLLSVVLAGALLWAGASAWRQSPPPVAAAVVAAVSPTTSFLVGAVNPQGVEIVAAVAFVLAGTGAVQQWRTGRVSRTGLAAVVVTGAYLATNRPSSYVFAMALAAVLTLAALPQVLELARRRARLIVPLLLGLLALLAVGVRYRTARPTLHYGDRTLSTAEAVTLVLVGLPGRLREIGGVFNYYDHEAPLLLALIPLVLVFGFAVTGWGTARGLEERLAIVALAFGATLVGPLFAVLTVFVSGSGYSARYTMPLLQALPVLSAWVWWNARGQGGTGRTAQQVVAAVPLLVLVVHLLDAGGSWLRFGLGLPLPVGRRVLEAVEWVPPPWPLLVPAVALSAFAARRLRCVLLAEQSPEEVAVTTGADSSALREHNRSGARGRP